MRVFKGEAQNLERPNVERPIFRNFEISNIEITKDGLFNFKKISIIRTVEYIIIYRIGKFSNFDSFSNCLILEIL